MHGDTHTRRIHQHRLLPVAFPRHTLYCSSSSSYQLIKATYVGVAMTCMCASACNVAKLRSCLVGCGINAYTPKKETKLVVAACPSRPFPPFRSSSRFSIELPLVVIAARSQTVSQRTFKLEKEEKTMNDSQEDCKSE